MDLVLTSLESKRKRTHALALHFLLNKRKMIYYDETVLERNVMHLITLLAQIQIQRQFIEILQNF